MNEKSTNTPGIWIDPDDAPELSAADFDRADATWSIGGQPVSAELGKAAFGRALRKSANKQKISIALDADVLGWYKDQAGGRGYQTLINYTLRTAMQQQDVAETLRQVLREELQRI